MIYILGLPVSGPPDPGPDTMFSSSRGPGDQIVVGKILTKEEMSRKDFDTLACLFKILFKVSPYC